MSAAITGGAGEGLRRDILTTLLPGFAGPDAPEWLLGLLAEGLGGVCVFGTNVESPAQLAGLTGRLREANPDAVVAIDEEGGDVTRLFFDRGAPYPGNAVLGRIDDVELTRAVGRAVGDALAAAGCTMTFAPDADINSNPLNPVIGVRSFGASLLFTALGVGLLVTSMVLASRHDITRPGLLIAVALSTGLGVCVVLMGASRSFVLTMLVMVAWGMGGGTSMTLQRGLLQRHRLRQRCRAVQPPNVASANILCFLINIIMLAKH